MLAAIVGAIAALGGRELIMGLVGWLSGRQDREKSRVRELVAERDAAEADRDREASYRRILQEYASTCRAIMISHNIPAAQIPPFPARPSS